MAQSICNTCNGTGVVEYDIPFTHNAGRDVGYVETATETCEDCSGSGVDPASNIKIYRVCIRKRDETVEVKCLDILAVDSELEHEYTNVHELPSWVQSKIAVLMTIQDVLLPVEVEGVGRRIKDDTYWIYSDES